MTMRDRPSSPQPNREHQPQSSTSLQGLSPRLAKSLMYCHLGKQVKLLAKSPLIHHDLYNQNWFNYKDY